MHAQRVAKKLAIAGGVINKLRCYAPISILRCVYFSFVYYHLQYCVSKWGNSTAKYINKIQVQQSYIIKIISKAPFYKPKFLPLCNELKLLKLNNRFRLQVLKMMCKFKTNSLPKCFSDFFKIPSNVHSYTTSYASGDNYSLTRFKITISQRSIRYVGPKLWNELPSDLKNYAQKIFACLLNK